jgi:glycosyltransferase involved in cell wall biosynthesis
VDMSHGHGRAFRPELYPAAEITHGAPTAKAIQRFLKDLDVVFTAETAYNNQLYPLARQAGVKVVVQPNYEFFDRNATPDLWAVPSMWHWDDIPEPKVLLPVPIATDRFPQRPTRGRATRFVHIGGWPAIHDRNGTTDLLEALQFVQSPITVAIKGQDAHALGKLMRGYRVPSNVELIFDARDVPDYWDNYSDGDVLVMPRRFGGLCLPTNEALGAGMPVIMPDISPNNTWLPAEWLVSATCEAQFKARTLIDIHTVDHRALAAKIDQFATDATFYAHAEATARDMAKRMSWESLRPEYDRMFAAL